MYGTLLALLRDREAAEDCTQEAFLRAYRAWPRWRPERPAEAWVHRIALNVAVSHHRRQRLGEVKRLIGFASEPRRGDPADSLATSALLRELDKLPHDQAAALVLRYVHGYSNREIAYAVGVPERTIASRLIRARDKLRTGLGREDQWRTSGSARVSLGE